MVRALTAVIVRPFAVVVVRALAVVTVRSRSAGGLASRYRFGARTGGSNLIIGAIFIVLALLLGERIVGVIYLLPMSALGVLLIFAGAQLSLTLLDMKTRQEMFVVILVLGITLAANLAAGFLAGIAIAYALKSEKLKV